MIFSENCQDWTSSEFTFGFDVNEELVANTNTVEADTNVVNDNIDQVQSCPQYFIPDTVDMHDNAILSFGPAGAEGGMRPLIVGVPVGVPIPVSSFSGLPGFYPGAGPGAVLHQFPGPVYNLQYPTHVAMSEDMEDNELMAEKMASAGAADAGLEDHTISPESGISSSSPLSWQPDSSPSLPAPGCYNRDRNLPLVSQVSESLSNWSGHGSDQEEGDTTLGPGWATQVEMAEVSSGQDSGVSADNSSNNGKKPSSNTKTEKFNFVEIVNFVSDSWSTVSEDNSVQVFQS